MSRENTRRQRCRWTKSDSGPAHSTTHPFGGRKLVTSSGGREKRVVGEIQSRHEDGVDGTHRSASGNRSGEEMTFSRQPSVGGDELERNRFRILKNISPYDKSLSTGTQESDSIHAATRPHQSYRSPSSGDQSNDNDNASIKRPNPWRKGMITEVDTLWEDPPIQTSDGQNGGKRIHYTIRNRGLKSISRNPSITEETLSQPGRDAGSQNIALATRQSPARLPSVMTEFSTDCKDVSVKDLPRSRHQRSMVRLIDHLQMKESSDEVSQHQSSAAERCYCKDCVLKRNVSSSNNVGYRGRGARTTPKIHSNSDKRGIYNKSTNTASPTAFKDYSRCTPYRDIYHNARDNARTPTLGAAELCQNSSAEEMGRYIDSSPTYTGVSSNYFCQCPTGQSDFEMMTNQSYNDNRCTYGPKPHTEGFQKPERWMDERQDGEHIIDGKLHDPCLDAKRSYGRDDEPASDNLSRECERCHELFSLKDVMNQLRVGRRETTVLKDNKGRKEYDLNSGTSRQATITRGKPLEFVGSMNINKTKSPDRQTPQINQNHNEDPQSALTRDNKRVSNNAKQLAEETSYNCHNLYHQYDAEQTNKLPMSYNCSNNEYTNRSRHFTTNEDYNKLIDNFDSLTTNLNQKKHVYSYGNENMETSRHQNAENEFQSSRDSKKIYGDRAKRDYLGIKTCKERLSPYNELSQSQGQAMACTPPGQSGRNSKRTRKEISAFYARENSFTSRISRETARTAPPWGNKESSTGRVSCDSYKGPSYCIDETSRNSISNFSGLPPTQLGNRRNQHHQQPHRQFQANRHSDSSISFPSRPSSRLSKRGSSNSPSRTRSNRHEYTVGPQISKECPANFLQSTRTPRLINQLTNQNIFTRHNSTNTSHNGAPYLYRTLAPSSNISQTENISSVSNTHLFRKPDNIWSTGAHSGFTPVDRNDGKGQERFFAMIQAVKERLQDGMTRELPELDANASNIAVKSKADSSFLADYIISLWENQWLCDVQVMVQGRQLLAHKLILAAFSDVFCPNNPNPPPSICFEIPDSNFEAVEQIFTYMYTGSMDLTDQLLEPVLQAAMYMGVSEVVCLVQDIMYSADVDSIQMYMEIAKSNSVVYNLAKTPAVRQSMSALIDTGFFPSISKQDMHEILDDPDVEVESEEVTLQAALEWILAHPEVDVYTELPKLLRKITLESIPPNRLTGYMRDYPDLFSIPEVTDIMLGIFQFHATKCEQRLAAKSASNIFKEEGKSKSLLAMAAERCKSMLGHMNGTTPSPSNKHLSRGRDSDENIYAGSRTPRLSRVSFGNMSNEGFQRGTAYSNPYGTPQQRKLPAAHSDIYDGTDTLSRQPSKVRFGFNNSHTKATQPRVYNVRPSRKVKRGTLTNDEFYSSHNNNNSVWQPIRNNAGRRSWTMAEVDMKSPVTYSSSRNEGNSTNEHSDYCSTGVDPNRTDNVPKASGGNTHDHDYSQPSDFPKMFDTSARTRFNSYQNAISNPSHSQLPSLSVLNNVEMREFDPICSVPVVKAGDETGIGNNSYEQNAVDSTFEIDEAGCPIISATDDNDFDETDQSISTSPAYYDPDVSESWLTDQGANPSRRVMGGRSITPNRFSSRPGGRLYISPRTSRSLSFLGHDDSISAFKQYNP